MKISSIYRKECLHMCWYKWSVHEKKEKSKVVQLWTVLPWLGLGILNKMDTTQGGLL